MLGFLNFLLDRSQDSETITDSMLIEQISTIQELIKTTLESNQKLVYDNARNIYLQ